jgi:hypothetical protein
MKRLIAILIASILVGNTVYASQDIKPTRENNGLTTNNILQQNDEEREYMIEELINDVLRKENVATDIFYDCFDGECVSRFSSLVSDNVLEVSNIIYKSIELAKSDNKNYILANVKISYKNDFNICYLFKFGINSSGKIESYNIYQY